MSGKAQLEAAISRIAKMEHSGVPRKQIASACGLTEMELASVLEKPAFKAALAEVSAESFDNMDVLNGGWDLVENLAVNKVVDHLQKVPDPDFALRAASLANKAIRRGKHENNPIGLQPNNQAVINVSVQFADKLQQNFQVNKTEVKELKKKDDNFLSPKAVAQMLSATDVGKKAALEKEVADEIGNLELLMPAF